MRMPRDSVTAGTLRPFGMLKAWSSLGALPRHPRTMLTYDASLAWAAILLLAIGLVMVVLGVDRDGRGVGARRVPLVVLPGAPRDVHRRRRASRRSSPSRCR